MPTNWEKLGRCLKAGGEQTVSIFKVIVFDDRDYAYACEVATRFPKVPMYLQVGNDNPPGAATGDVAEPDVLGLLEWYAWLSERVLSEGWNDATVLPQLHVLVYGNKRGV